MEELLKELIRQAKAQTKELKAHNELLNRFFEQKTELIDNKMLTPLEVSELLKCNRQKIYKMIKDGSIKPTYVGGSILIESSQLNQLLKK